MSFKLHPERMAEEVFVTNSDATLYDEIGWKTKRRGSTAYDTHGVPLGHRWPGAFPVFARIDEVRRENPDALLRMKP